MNKFNPNEHITTTTIPDEGDYLGDIKINHSVVASIVRLASLEIPGVTSIGSSLVEGITEIFSKKESDRGVRISEDESNNYLIEVRVILKFGVELAKIAFQVQQNVKQKVEHMTLHKVAKVDVIIDGIRVDDPKQKAKLPDQDL